MILMILMDLKDLMFSADSQRKSPLLPFQPIQQSDEMSGNLYKDCGNISKQDKISAVPPIIYPIHYSSQDEWKLI